MSQSVNAVHCSWEWGEELWEGEMVESYLIEVAVQSTLSKKYICSTKQ